MDAWDIEIENVAGIRAGTAAIHPGINAVQAENWQGKTSFIAAIETVMGTAQPLTEGQDEATVRLDTGDETYETALVRSGETVTADGQPYLEDQYDRLCAELYAFLDATNEVRAAVRNGDNLEATLTRPLAVENIDERIADRQSLRQQVASDIDRVQAAADRLPKLQEAVEAHEEELERLRERRTELVDEGQQAGSTSRQEISSVRAELEQLAARIERLGDSIERTETTLEDRRAKLESLSDESGLEEISTELTTERDALAGVERDVDILQSIYAAAKRLLDEDRFELLADVEHGFVSDTFSCVLCGTELDRDKFETHLESIGDVVSQHRERISAHQDRIAELEATRAAIEEQRHRRTALESEIVELEETLGERRESLAQARDRRRQLDEQRESLAETVEADDEELTDVESEIKFIQAELEAARHELETCSDQAANRDRLEREHGELTEEIEALRNRKGRIKQRARQAFDDAIADLLDRFEIGFESARLTGSFELVVARDGREASLEALSEGELELLGLVAALAGHRAFDVADTVPLMLLDDLGGLSNDSLHTIVPMLQEHVDRVVLTAYPEHSQFDGHVIDPTEWAVVSDGSEVGARP